MVFARWMCASVVRDRVVNPQCEHWLPQDWTFVPFATLRRFRTTAAVRRSAAASKQRGYSMPPVIVVSGQQKQGIGTKESHSVNRSSSETGERNWHVIPDQSAAFADAKARSSS